MIVLAHVHAESSKFTPRFYSSWDLFLSSFSFSLLFMIFISFFISFICILLFALLFVIIIKFYSHYYLQLVVVVAEVVIITMHVTHVIDWMSWRVPSVKLQRYFHLHLLILV